MLVKLQFNKEGAMGDLVQHWDLGGSSTNGRQ